MKITDEAVEAAALSMYRRIYPRADVRWQADEEDVRRDYRADARNALEAALPHLEGAIPAIDRERIAAVLRDHTWIPSESRCSCGDEYIEFVSHHQAEAILALIGGAS